jgi:hypothetical protein
MIPGEGKAADTKGGEMSKRNRRLVSASPLIALLLCLASPAAGLNCAPTVRMPYEQSHAIKLSMLPPGHAISARIHRMMR